MGLPAAADSAVWQLPGDTPTYPPLRYGRGRGPTRCGIVERLAAGPATVGDATAGFGVSKPAISKHLKVLEETGVVTRVVEGRTHRLSLEPKALEGAAEWMERQREIWERLFDVVDEYLQEKEPK